MSELRPYPFGLLVRRMLREARAESKVFDLPLSKCFFGPSDGLDIAVDFHGRRAATPLGPAAGPHSQMAQNLVLSWLVGCRVLELKTVQVLDQLEIPRPCIDMATVGFNVEWSQELRLAESLEEYVKGSMLIEILRASGELPASVGPKSPFGDVIFDMSVGYDLAGVQTDTVQSFICGMQDASAYVVRLRAELLSEEMRDLIELYPQFETLEFETRLSNTLTLSTFHGCPPDEIERIGAFLMEHNGLDVIVKLNPTLLGADRVRELLEDCMGYTDLFVPDRAFEADMVWDDMLGIVERLGALARAVDVGFGVKFTNTQIVENNRDFFPESEKEMYLSGAPLHVLAMELVGRFRASFGDRYPISFSAGIDRSNFARTVALGIVPVTVCTDLLRPGGYGRATKYFDRLAEEMQEVHACSVDDYCIRGFGHGERALALVLESEDPPEEARIAKCKRALAEGTDLRSAAGEALHNRWKSAALLLNTEDYVGQVILDARYGASKNSRPPKKIGEQLVLFDCTTCDKCVPVCPNHANFVFTLPRLEVAVQRIRPRSGGWAVEELGPLVIEKAKQYGNFADFCNECGNCDVFCPEDGGPYVIKPRFFGSLEDWNRFANENGFFLSDEGRRLRGRIGGVECSLAGFGEDSQYSGSGFNVQLDPANPLSSIRGTWEEDAVIDLTHLHILQWVRDAIASSEAVNYLNASFPLAGH